MSIYCYGCGLSICIKRLSMNGSIPNVPLPLRGSGHQSLCTKQIIAGY